MVMINDNSDRGIIGEKIPQGIRPKGAYVLFFPVFEKVLLFWTKKKKCPETKRDILEKILHLWYNLHV